MEEESQKTQVIMQELLEDEVYKKGISDLRFLEERISQAKRARKMKEAIALGSVIVVLICVVSFLELRKRRKQKERREEPISAQIPTLFDGYILLCLARNSRLWS